MSKIKEFVIRFIDVDLDSYLNSKGFFQIKRGIFENLDGSRRIILDDGRIKCVSVEQSFMLGDERVEMEISFVPEIPILEHLLKGIYFIR
jgi:hypothetical protein